MDGERQTGRTARQMLDAPKYAVFVWCNNRTDYPRALAAFLGRKDLRIITPDDICTCHKLHGARYVVVDHAAYILSEEAWARIEMIRRAE